MAQCCDIWNAKRATNCGIYQGVIVAGMAVTGIVATVIATTATVAAVAIAAGLFAAPAVAAAAVMIVVLSIPSALKCLKETGVFFLHAASFALFSAAAIAGGVALGILAPALMITFIVAASIVTLALLAIAVCVPKKASQPDPTLVRS